MTRRSPRSAGTAGFTLLEALMAVALMAAILGSLATITAQWLPNWNRGFASVQRSELTALGLERLTEDLAAAVSVPVRGERGEVVFDGAELSVLFVRPAAGPNSVGLEVVRIGETSGERGSMLVRTRAPFVPANEDVLGSLRPNFADPVVLLRAPYRVSFAYAGPDRVWRDTWRGSPLLPRAIRLTVRDAATGRRLALSTAVEVRAELPAECARVTAIAACPAMQAPGAAAQASGAGGSTPR
jgi:general secretion pathway protein J